MPRKKKGDQEGGEVVPFAQPIKLAEAGSSLDVPHTVLQVVNHATSRHQEYRAIVVVGILPGDDAFQLTWSGGASKAELAGFLQVAARKIWDLK